MVIRVLVIAHHIHVIAWKAVTVVGVGGIFGKTSLHDWNALLVVVGNGSLGAFPIRVDVCNVAVQSNTGLVSFTMSSL
jgi:hypothetical protein